MLENLFKLKERHTDVKTEVIAGFTTFITMAYIIFVNPSILSTTGLDKHAVFFATCIGAAVGTLIMALYANLPFALAPGMGLNAFFTYTVCLQMKYTPQQALAAVFISGIIFVLITAVGLRQAIVKSIPQPLKHAMTAGIGLFIAFIGFINSGIVVFDPGSKLPKFGDFTAAFNSFTNNPDINKSVIASRGALIAVIGLLIIGILIARRVKGAIIIGIIITTIISFPLKIVDLSKFKFSLEAFKVSAFNFDFAGLFSAHNQGGGIGAVLLSLFAVVLTFTLIDMFDSIGTFVGLADKAGMLDEKGDIPNMDRALMSDAIATIVGAIFGTSTVTTYIESAAGIEEGGRTGLTSLVTGILFILALIIAPFIGLVPTQATAPALIAVGVMMISSIKKIDFSDFEEALPAFLTIVIMPFTYSIANGISAGIIFYVLVKLLRGKAKEVHPITYVLAILFILRFMVIAH
ncbi:NCS2 family permease [Caldicellulosiruptor naganoensis]|uniref:NCS2 family permease n=1 Tax=Caldicellulosiruptor naganoensis TaxID=29324 RepID=A0ABY7BCF4_9FIRM|nr:NCS2 family permease [Caldicellulosiruptor naganoensis]WAM30518.1 NCS2 family permease [Caldicellulosiruptor naganoensis]